MTPITKLSSIHSTLLKDAHSVDVEAPNQAHAHYKNYVGLNIIPQLKKENKKHRNK